MMNRYTFLTLVLLAATSLSTANPALSEIDPAVLASSFEQIKLLSTRIDGQGLVDYGRALRAGVQPSADNPLKISDNRKAREALEAALVIPGPHLPEAQTTLGKMLLAGEGGRLDAERALTLFEEAARGGQAEAAFLAGQTLAKQNVAEARHYLQLALRLGFAPAAFELAGMTGTSADQARSMTDFAKRLLQKRAAEGDARSAYQLADYLRGSYQNDDELRQALAWYRKANTLGHERSAFWIARLQSEAGSVLFDAAEAVKYYEIAAENGDAEAARKLVEDFSQDGDLDVSPEIFDRWINYLAGVRDAKAVFYFSMKLENSLDERKKLSDDLYAKTMNGETGGLHEVLRIGDMFRSGDGVISDPKRALDIFQIAADRRSRDGILSYAKLVIDEPSVRTDKAIAFTRQALEELADRGVINAAVLRGDLAAKGVGGDIDVGAAITWYGKALERRRSPRLLNRLADAYLLSPVKVEREKVVPLLEEGVALKSNAAMLRLARIYAEGDLVGCNLTKAKELLEQAIALGRTDSLIELADLHMRIGGPGAFEKAYETFAKAVSNGNPEAPVEMARFLKSYGKMHEAVPFLKSAAEAGSFSAAIDLYNLLSAESDDPNVGKEWLARASEMNGLGPSDRFILARALLRPDDPLLNLKGFSIVKEMDGSGYPGSAAVLASIHIGGRLVEKNAAEAVRILEAGAQRGDTGAVMMLADLLMEGVEVPADLPRALDYYNRVLAVEPGNATVNLRLARLYGEGIGVKQDNRKAAAYFEIASNAGSRSAQRELGLAYLWGAGVGRDRQRAEQNLRAAAEKGFDRAWHDLAFLYSGGFGASVDPATAFRFNHKGATRGDPAAMVEIGIALLSGFGASRDPEAGVFWLEKAAATSAEEAPLAMYRLHEAYKLGLGVTKDASKAQAWLEKASAAGSASAMFQAALALRADPSEASQAEGLTWLKRAQALKHNQANKILQRLHSAPHTAASEVQHDDPDGE